jgi:hypothetical protein
MLPGLIDRHVHLRQDPSASSRSHSESLLSQHAERTQQIINPLVRVPGAYGACFLVLDVLEIGNKLGAHVFGGRELLSNLQQAFLHQPVPQVRSECRSERVEPTRIVGHRETDVPRVLFLQSFSGIPFIAKNATAEETLMRAWSFPPSGSSPSISVSM